MENIKPCVLLMNDIHVSKDNISEFYSNWNEALDICEKHDIKTIMVGGDLWQSRASQALSTLLAVRQALISANSKGIVVVMAEGNHDLVDQEAMLGYCHVFDQYPQTVVVNDYECFEIADNVFIYIMSYFPESGTFTQRLAGIIANELNKNAYNILYIHEGINGALAKPNDNELPAKIFSDFNKVLVGHYHDRIKIPGTNIEYIGASRQHNFGEDEEKGYTIVFSDGSIQFIKNQSNIRYKVIEALAENINENLFERLREIKEDGKYKVKTKISCTSAEASTINKQLLLEAGASKIEIKTVDTELLERNTGEVNKKFDKGDLKSEYQIFCEDKEIDMDLGLQYLDKINTACGN